MKSTVLIAAALAAVALVACAANGGPAPPGPGISAALADPARPDADRQRDAARHPAELLAFAGVRPGQKVADFVPGGGYFTRIFSKAVGPQGKVYAVFTQAFSEFAKADVEAIKATEANPAFGNVSMVVTPNDAFRAPEPLDLVWTSQNYHDLQFGLSHEQIIQFNKTIFAALKPGGVFLVIDHASAPGAGWTVARSLHRIDPEAVKADMAAAGFRFEGESDVLRNPNDPRTATVFDASIRGRTDQVVFKFRKPG